MHCMDQCRDRNGERERGRERERSVSKLILLQVYTHLKTPNLNLVFPMSVSFRPIQSSNMLNQVALRSNTGLSAEQLAFLSFCHFKLKSRARQAPNVWISHTLLQSALIPNFSVLPGPCKNTAQKNYAVWLGFYAVWLGFYAVSKLAIFIVILKHSMFKGISWTSWSTEWKSKWNTATEGSELLLLQQNCANPLAQDVNVTPTNSGGMSHTKPLAKLSTPRPPWAVVASSRSSPPANQVLIFQDERHWKLSQMEVGIQY